MKETRLGCFYVTAILSWGKGRDWVEVGWYWVWGWGEVENKLSRSLAENELRLSWVGNEIR